MIPTKTWYKTHNKKLLVIVEVFKTWHYYLKGCKYKVLVFIDHNNLRQFLDIKILSFFQVCWAQELSQYHFQIDYCQRKANVTADALFHFSQKSQAEEKMLQNENTQIFHHLYISLSRASLVRLSLLGHKTALSSLH